MRITFLSHYFSPHIGGVEKHVFLLSKELIKKGHEVLVITEKFDKRLKDKEVVDGIKVIRFSYPKIKFFGIFYIWVLLWAKRKLFFESDVIHIHDVFIWYLPFRFLLPAKKSYITIHGYEVERPFSFSSVLQKRMAVKLSNGNIGVGKFLEKYLNVKFDLVTFGAVNTKQNIRFKKRRNSVVFVGRLSKDTGVLQFLNWLKKHRNLKASFVGSGELRNKCEKFGKVYGFTDPQKFLKKSEYCVPGGYLACLEAFSFKCKVKVFWGDNLKKDYWQMSPMYKFIKNEDLDEAYEWVKEQSWEKMAEKYINLWKLV